MAAVASDHERQKHQPNQPRLVAARSVRPVRSNEISPAPRITNANSKGIRRASAIGLSAPAHECIGREGEGEEDEVAAEKRQPPRNDQEQERHREETDRRVVPSATIRLLTARRPSETNCPRAR